jgi:hypothetical protein
MRLDHEPIAKVIAAGIARRYFRALRARPREER